jgi:hypothetical protein
LGGVNSIFMEEEFSTCGSKQKIPRNCGIS